MGLVIRNVVEYAAIFGLWWGTALCLVRWTDYPILCLAIVLCLSLMKSAFFGLENLRQLFEATRDNQPYHRFMLLMLVNMSQIIVSFGLDYHCLHLVSPGSFGELSSGPWESETVFEFVYFSTLNFTFFGYGDMTPLTIPAKLLTMSEILLAFITVIFLLSDFISLKESLLSGNRRKLPSTANPSDTSI